MADGAPGAGDVTRLWAWGGVPTPRFVGGNRVELLEGGDQLFPRMCAAIDAAEREVWIATYIFYSDDASRRVADALVAAARRGVAVHLVVDGFGCLGTLAVLRQWLHGTPVRLEVFRALDRWWAWLQPGQLRRLHQKLCFVDETQAFVGGINIIDDRRDLNHGRTETPRLDFAVEVRGPLAQQVRATARAMWARAHLGRGWREELRLLLRSETPLGETLALLRALRARPLPQAAATAQQPVLAAFVVRDNFRLRRTIERSYIDAIRAARVRVDIAVPYFYPGHGFRRALRRAARRGVHVRLLLQGKIDYRIAAMAARAMYDEMQGHGVRIFEYTPAFLHAKVAVVDDDWATVGSSNIDPLSLLLNLEANVVVRDRAFAAALSARFEAALAASVEVTVAPARQGWRGWLQRGLVAWFANVYLRVAGITGRY
jgi:cardiolipin synthase